MPYSELSYAAQGVLFKAGVQNGIGYLIGHLVGMTFTHGFGGKKKIAGHCHAPYKVRQKRHTAERWIGSSDIMSATL